MYNEEAMKDWLPCKTCGMERIELTPSGFCDEKCSEAWKEGKYGKWAGRTQDELIEDLPKAVKKDVV